MKFEGKRVAKVAPLSANRVAPLAANQVVPLRRKWNGSIAVQINKWTEIAIKNNVNVTKEVGVIKDSGSVEFTFFSNNGNQVLDIKINDWENQFKKSSVMIVGVESMKEFKAIFDNIDKPHQEVMERERNAELFK